eukprot:TRINITY_DN462_c0_g1_i1.p1 TRINITY_DN462_c0_g1~~TRINITY_DN462_c0_g1_i1.p1  ORF type:complete len:529 (+),score=156.13 TRINITY_DN462_c0_g1_i1:74-1588(+)
MRRALLLLGAAGAAAGADKCDPTPCVDGTCDPSCCWDTPLHHYPLNVSAWDSATRRYRHLGAVDAWYAWDDMEPVDPVRDLPEKIGTMMHGPKYHQADLAASSGVPATYVSATASGKVFLFDSFAPDMSAAKKKALAWTDAPSTQYNVYDAANRTTHMLVADGSPFWISPDEHHGLWINRGGVHVVRTAPPHNNSQCTKIFPDEADDPKDLRTGRVVNTIDCHKDTGFCFLSLWKFDGKASDKRYPDCMHWCLLDNPTDPRHCALGGLLHDENGVPVCRNTDSHQLPADTPGATGGGGVHGFSIGRSGSGDNADLDLFLAYTGGPDDANKAAGCKDVHQCGASWVRKLTVRLSRNPGNISSSTLQVLESAPWGRELWADTVANHSVADVGCQFTWVDPAKKHVWVSTSREMTDGLSMLDYDTGKLLYTINGYSAMRGWPNGTQREGAWYSYTAGLIGRGVAGEPGAMLSFATSESYPLGMLPGQMHGRGSVFWVDVSRPFGGRH